MASGRSLPALDTAILAPGGLWIFHFNIPEENPSRIRMLLKRPPLVLLFSTPAFYFTEEYSAGHHSPAQWPGPLEACVIKKHLGFACWL